jgi:hypothetical protein
MLAEALGRALVAQMEGRSVSIDDYEEATNATPLFAAE